MVRITVKYRVSDRVRDRDRCRVTISFRFRDRDRGSEAINFGANSDRRSEPNTVLHEIATKDVEFSFIYVHRLICSMHSNECLLLCMLCLMHASRYINDGFFNTVTKI